MTFILNSFIHTFLKWQLTLHLFWLLFVLIVLILSFASSGSAGNRLMLTVDINTHTNYLVYYDPKRILGFTFWTEATVTTRAVRGRWKLVHVKSTAVPYTDFSLPTTTVTPALTNLALHSPFILCRIFTNHPERSTSSTPVLWYTRGGQLSSCSSHEPVPAVEVEDVITDLFVEFVVYRAITIFEDLIIAALIRSCSNKSNEVI